MVGSDTDRSAGPVLSDGELRRYKSFVAVVDGVDPQWGRTQRLCIVVPVQS